MKINEWLEKTYEGNGFYARPHIECNDGFSISIQASPHCYCHPREFLKDGEYEEVEAGFPSVLEELIIGYAEDSSRPTQTVYGYIPVELIDQVIEKHGGMISYYLT